MFRGDEFYDVSRPDTFPDEPPLNTWQHLLELFLGSKVKTEPVPKSKAESNLANTKKIPVIIFLCPYSLHKYP